MAYPYDAPKCEEHRLRLCLRTVAGRDIYGYQCTGCGFWRSVAKAKLSRVEQATRTRYDQTITDGWRKKLDDYYQRRTEEARQEQAAKTSEWWQSYNAYLETEEWQEKRRQVLSRAKGTCEGCGEGEPRHVHHLTYEHVTNEFLWELVAVCRDCHERLHPTMTRGPRLILGGVR